QQLQSGLDRAVKFSETSGVTGVTIAQGTDGQIPTWDQDGNLIPKTPADISGLPVVAGAIGLDILGSDTAPEVVTALNVKALNADGGFAFSGATGPINANTTITGV